jgi:hypothetical protein
VTSSCEYGDEPSDSIKGMNFNHCLSDYQLVRRTLLRAVSNIGRSVILDWQLVNVAM